MKYLLKTISSIGLAMLLFVGLESASASARKRFMGIETEEYILLLEAKVLLLEARGKISLGLCVNLVSLLNENNNQSLIAEIEECLALENPAVFLGNLFLCMPEAACGKKNILPFIVSPAAITAAHS